MILFISIIQILTAILLVVVVLLQDAKGGGVFGVGGGGGGSNQILSSTGAASFLVNLTWGLAIVFAATSITLTYMTTSHTGSVVDSYVPPAAATKTNAPSAADSGAAAGKSTVPATTPNSPKGK